MNEIHFVDTNIPMYAAGGSHPLKEPCLRILSSIVKGEILAVTNAEVIQEILHRYTSIQPSKQEIQSMWQ